MIDIRPDPAHPQGGHAILVLPADAVRGDSVPVSVRDNYGGRFLGENGFQATQVAFGPYAVERTGAEARIVIGPEIVNQIEEYTAVRVIVGDTAADLSWPDSVVPAPGAPALGGIYRAPDAAGSALTGIQAPPAQVPTDPQPATDPDPTPPAPDPVAATATPDERAEPSSRRLPLIVGLVALLAVAGAAGYFLLTPQDAPPAPAPVVAAPPLPPPTPADPCAADSLDAAFGAGFGTLADRLRACATQVSADDALLYVERAATAGDADALTLFGTLYDGERTDAALETDMGLTFGDAPDRAAGYYARAVEAGSDAAAGHLQATCARLEGVSDTLSQGAFADHCAPK